MTSLCLLCLLQILLISISKPKTDIALTIRLQCLLVTWLKWEAIPLTVSDAVDKGWILRDECRGELKMQHKLSSKATDVAYHIYIKKCRGVLLVSLIFLL